MLWEIVKSRMMLHPDQTVCEGDIRLRYADMVTQAERLARDLRAPCCAVLCQSELNAAISMLACMAAGVTAVPLSYRYGGAHVQRILDFIHPPLIISDSNGKPGITDTDSRGYIEPEDPPAWILCTSGTTGQPKGVMLSEKNILSNVEDIARYFDVRSDDTILIARPLYHCAVLTGEFLLSLFKGVNIRFCPDAFQPAAILQLIRRHDVTVLCGTPTLLTLLGGFSRSPHALAGLRTLAVSGECLSPAVASGLSAQFAGKQIYHVYGLTEASPRVAFLPPEKFAGSGYKVGVPLASVRMKIVDAEGNPTPDGTDGELLVSGPNVMMGYYRNPSLTEKALAGGWLHTGDIACKDPDGLYQLRGRKDDMIIRAGMNIYPAEIEAALKTDPRVAQALAYGFNGVGGGTQIGLKIAGTFSTQAEIIALCRTLLPEYEQPARIQLVEELPRNGSGKIKRN